MHTAFHFSKAAAGICLAALSLVNAPVWAQAHSVTDGAYTLRASTVNSQHIAAATAAKHGIDVGPRKAIINVTLSRSQGEQSVTVPAGITVTARNLTGLERNIPMRDTSTEGYVSYMGTFDIVHNEVVDFIVTARPADGKTVTLRFRERLPVL